MLLALMACTEGGGPLGRNISNYDVTLLVRHPKNQSPLEGVDTLELVLDHAEGDPEIFELNNVDSPQIDGLGELEGTRVVLRGYSGDVLVAYGSTTPLSAHRESVEQTLLVAEVDQMAWLEPAASGRGLGALVADGQGSFWLFGGESKNPGAFGQGWSSETHNTIWRLDVAPPDSLAFVDTGATLLDFVGAADGQTHSGRMGHTGTLLTGNVNDAGLILLAGGAAEGTQWDTATYHAFLFDPTTGDSISLGADPMRSARFQHTAVEHVSGDVFLMGGWGRAASGNLDISDSWEIYRRSSRSFEIGDGKVAGGPYGAAASVGSEGVLHCGGINVVSGNLQGGDECNLLQPSGSNEPLESPGNQRVSHHAMASLGSGRVLLTGGIDADVEQYAEVDALADAWIFDVADKSWTAVGDMNVARANHTMVSLPDGRVLVLGGATKTHVQSSQGAALACVEIFDPATDTFEMLEGCTPESTSSTLPSQVMWPMAAVDEDYGVVIAGGFGDDEKGDTNTSLWLPQPAEQFE